MADDGLTPMTQFPQVARALERNGQMGVVDAEEIRRVYRDKFGMDLKDDQEFFSRYRIDLNHYSEAPEEGLESVEYEEDYDDGHEQA